MMKVRKLNAHGLQEFSRFVDSLRSGIEQNVPSYLLTDDSSSESLSFEVEIDTERAFTTRYDMGVYLVEILDDENIQEYMGDAGFWSWFALLWFDQLCPRKKGIKKPSQVYNYVLSSSHRHRFRHAIYMTWQLVNRYGESVRFMLSKEPSTRGELTEQLLRKQQFMTSNGFIELANLLYFDPEKKTFKRGATGRTSPGCVYRYVSWIEQILLNYDIFSMKKEELEEILPSEFNRFRVVFKETEAEA